MSIPAAFMFYLNTFALYPHPIPIVSGPWPFNLPLFIPHPTVSDPISTHSLNCVLFLCVSYNFGVKISKSRLMHCANNIISSDCAYYYFSGFVAVLWCCTNSFVPFFMLLLSSLFSWTVHSCVNIYSLLCYENFLSFVGHSLLFADWCVILVFICFVTVTSACQHRSEVQKYWSFLAWHFYNFWQH